MTDTPLQGDALQREVGADFPKMWYSLGSGLGEECSKSTR